MFLLHFPGLLRSDLSKENAVTREQLVTTKLSTCFGAIGCAAISFMDAGREAILVLCFVLAILFLVSSTLLHAYSQKPAEE